MTLLGRLEEERKQVERDLQQPWCIGAHRDVAYKRLERVNNRIKGLKTWRRNQTYSY